ncbi:MAG: histidine--tRNA ligase [Elusimicrobia bacterium]|nr:histidine--tRNA ligase [Elusimicrobiota bacterium]MDE2236711.1 histidine--tRNA ligase [Elusimicrobiota bacterium]MDE2425142.1 histidine--tRNA ligase [Elusimicrobiota bacterium]
MSQLPTAPPSGFRDFLPASCAMRARAAEAIAQVYRRFGFQQIATSAVEDLPVLLGKGGGENEKLIFKLMKRGAQLEEAKTSGGELADLGLRFDLTLPLARYYCRHGSTLPHPFKAFQMGAVWRAERAQKGRYREFHQCDADIIGSDSPLCEAEIISALLTAFEAAGLREAPQAVVNDRELLQAVLSEAGLPAEKTAAACVALDKLDKTGVEAVRGELEALSGSEVARRLEELLLSKPGDLERLSRFQPQAAARVREILSLVNGLRADSAVFSATLIRGFDYYTGPVFEFRSPRLSGSLGGGGRYDRLTEKFGGQPIPACGASIGFERLLLLLEQEGLETAPGPDAVVTVFSEQLRAASLKAAAALRHAGYAIDLYPGAGKLKKQFQYADAKKAAYAVVIGPDELAAGQATVKDLATGKERSVALDSLAEAVKKG